MSKGIEVELQPRKGKRFRVVLRPRLTMPKVITCQGKTYLEAGSRMTHTVSTPEQHVAYFIPVYRETRAVEVI